MKTMDDVSKAFDESHCQSLQISKKGDRFHAVGVYIHPDNLRGAKHFYKLAGEGATAGEALAAAVRDHDLSKLPR